MILSGALAGHSMDYLDGFLNSILRAQFLAQFPRMQCHFIVRYGGLNPFRQHGGVQRLKRKVFWAYPQGSRSCTPVVLIESKGDRQRWNARFKCKTAGARSPVMHDGRHTREKPAIWRVFDGQDLFRKCAAKSRPTGMKDGLSTNKSYRLHDD